MPREQVVQHETAGRRGRNGDGVERVPDWRPGEVVRRPQPREERRRPRIETGRVERLVQPVGLEVDRYKHQMGGDPAVDPAHALPLEGLHAGLIHLEDSQAVRQLRAAQRVAVQTGAEDHVLPDPGRGRFGQPILRIARAGVLGGDGVETPQQLVDNDPVEQAVVGDLPPEWRHHPRGIRIVQDRVGMPPPVVRPDSGGERRRAADPSRNPAACSARRHVTAYSHPGPRQVRPRGQSGPIALAIWCCSLVWPSAVS